MDDDGTWEKDAMTNGTEGGVLHLLRLTRTQCHAWVAFLALRRDDGTIEVSAVPGSDGESSEWTLETLRGIAEKTFEDPLIGEGRAVIRVSEVFRRFWPGERQYTRMAVAPLNDVADSSGPWGLLCALDPVDGQFSEAQLDMLGRLAIRFINHLRVRRQFIEDVATSQELLESAMAPQHEQALPGGPGEPSLGGAEGIARIEATAAWLAQQPERPNATPAQPYRAQPAPGAASRVAPELATAEPPSAAAPEHAPLPGAAPTIGPTIGQEPSVRQDEVEVVFEATFPASTVATPEVGAGAPASEAGAHEGLGSPPPRRVRLSELIERLDETLARLRSSKRHGAFFLVEVPSGTSPRETRERAQAVAQRLSEATRHSDVVLGVGGDMLAVVMELGPRPADLDAIRTRLHGASAGGAEGALRASVLGLDPAGDTSGEALVLAAVRKLAMS
jgi:hypothetical protein